MSSTAPRSASVRASSIGCGGSVGMPSGSVLVAARKRVMTLWISVAVAEGSRAIARAASDAMFSEAGNCRGRGKRPLPLLTPVSGHLLRCAAVGIAVIRASRDQSLGGGKIRIRISRRHLAPRGASVFLNAVLNERERFDRAVPGGASGHIGSEEARHILFDPRQVFGPIVGFELSRFERPQNRVGRKGRRIRPVVEIAAEARGGGCDQSGVLAPAEPGRRADAFRADGFELFEVLLYLGRVRMRGRQIDRRQQQVRLPERARNLERVL